MWPKMKINIIDFAQFLDLRSHLGQFETCDVLASTETQDVLSQIDHKETSDF